MGTCLQVLSLFKGVCNDSVLFFFFFLSWIFLSYAGDPARQLQKARLHPCPPPTYYFSRTPHMHEARHVPKHLQISYKEKTGKLTAREMQSKARTEQNGAAEK